MPKMVIALVAVNFSWSACKVLIDFSNVATATVLAIPMDFMQTKGEVTTNLKCVLDKDGKMVKSKTSLCAPDINTFLVEEIKIATWLDKDKTMIKLNRDVEIGDILLAAESMDKIKGVDVDLNTSAVTYLLSLSGQEIVTLAKNQDKITNLETMSVDVFVSCLMAVAYFVVFICLFVVLMARLVVIWIVIAFSPLLVLQFALGGKFSITDKF